MSTLLLDELPRTRSVRLPSVPVVLRHEDRVAVTGEHCPTTGFWSSTSMPSAPVALRRGELMPPLWGRAVEWHYAEWHNAERHNAERHNTASPASHPAEPGH
jgi:hypothetical protein